MHRSIIRPLAALAAGLTLASCGFSEPTAPGVVTGGGPRHNPATHSEEWWLTIQHPDGTSTSFRVLISTFERCPVHARYPACKTSTAASHLTH